MCLTCKTSVLGVAQFPHWPGRKLPGPLTHRSFGGKQGKILFSETQQWGTLCKEDSAQVQREKALFLGAAVHLSTWEVDTAGFQYAPTPRRCTGTTAQLGDGKNLEKSHVWWRAFAFAVDFQI